MPPTEIGVKARRECHGYVDERHGELPQLDELAHLRPIVRCRMDEMAFVNHGPVHPAEVAEPAREVLEHVVARSLEADKEESRRAVNALPPDDRLQADRATSPEEI